MWIKTDSCVVFGNQEGSGRHFSRRVSVGYLSRFVVENMVTLRP